jgi:UTP-glucose-1-phosphate uridylyltransferase
VLRKAVIPAAGLGTRLLSVTKEQPKEMLPVFAKEKRCRETVLMSQQYAQEFGTENPMT